MNFLGIKSRVLLAYIAKRIPAAFLSKNEIAEIIIIHAMQIIELAPVHVISSLNKSYSILILHEAWTISNDYSLNVVLFNSLETMIIRLKV